MALSHAWHPAAPTDANCLPRHLAHSLACTALLSSVSFSFREECQKMRGVIAIGLAVVLGVVGCGPTQTKDNMKPAKTDEHEHGEGPHGGAVGDFGKYHIEFCVDHKKKEAKVYVLDGKTAKKEVAIEPEGGQLKASIRGLKTKDEFEVVLKADKKGAASCYFGTHEKLGVEQEFEGRVTGEVGGKKLSGRFKEEPE